MTGRTGPGAPNAGNGSQVGGPDARSVHVTGAQPPSSASQAGTGNRTSRLAPGRTRPAASSRPSLVTRQRTAAVPPSAVWSVRVTDRASSAASVFSVISTGVSASTAPSPSRPVLVQTAASDVAVRYSAYREIGERAVSSPA